MAPGDVKKKGRTFVYETGRGGTVRVSPHQNFEATPIRMIPGHGEWQEVPYDRLGSFYRSHRIRVVL